MYSKMLHTMTGMPPKHLRNHWVAREPKTRVTFRVGSDVVEALRRLPNQTAFVERSLREALGHICPLCHGSGDAPGVHLSVSDLKRQSIGRLDRASAAQLKALVRLGRQLLATQLELDPAGGEAGLLFRLAREDQLLLSGVIPSGRSELALSH